MAQREGLLNRDWEKTQIKVFGRWANKFLQQRGLTLTDITSELSDGVKLINLLEVVGKEEIGGKWHKAPKMRVQMLENCTMAIDYITKKKGVRLVGIGSDNIVDKNMLLTLGLVWSVINKFQIEDISVEEATARDALLIWCKKNTQGYEGVSVTNFTTSWSSGLAYCALIDHFRPDVLDFKTLDHSNPTENCEKAFAACQQLGITVFLDPEDLVGITPDEKSVVTQCAEFFHFFASSSKNDAMADRLKKTIAIQREISALQSSYEEEARAAVTLMEETIAKFNEKDYDETVPGIKGKLVSVLTYGREARPSIMERRGTALRTWATLQTRCKSTKRPVPVPPAGLEPEVLTSKLSEVDNNTADRRQKLTSDLKAAQKALVHSFDNECKKIIDACDKYINDGDNTTGPIEQQKETLAEIKSKIEALKGDATALQAQYQQLVDLKLSHKTRHTLVAIDSEIEQAISHIALLLDQLSVDAKIDEYNKAAILRVKEVSELEASLSKVEGSLEERRAGLLEKQVLFTNKSDLSDLQPAYEALEADELHLEIEHSPSTIKSLYDGLQAHVSSLLSEIDAAIAAEKGLEVSEDQMEEFRQNFNHFDKDKNKTLQYYELKACLTALGDTATDDECKQIIGKYMNGAEAMDFDGYVKFMLDRFSKAETADTTKDAFNALCQNQPHITDAQIDQYFRGEDAEYLKQNLPKVDGGYDFASWADNLYIQ